MIQDLISITADLSDLSSSTTVTGILVSEQFVTATAVLTGPVGPTGSVGATGLGFPTGGTTNQFLVKNSATDYDTHWTSAVTFIGIKITDTNGVLWNLGINTSGALVTYTGAVNPATYGSAYGSAIYA